MVKGEGLALSCGMRRRAARRVALLAAVFVAASAVMGRSESALSPAALSLAQIVAGMQAHDRAQTENLKHYESLRAYDVQYHGLGRASATMQVEVSYDAGHGKSFRIVSQSGSAVLRNSVLKRALESEEQASKEKDSTALNSANYRFRLEGSESVDGHTVYVLDVDPLKREKFLYKGRIWVNAADFAVSSMQVTPAERPSIWISGTTIWVTNELTDGFWLPKQMRSRTRVRIGGSAIMTIDYGQYRIQPASSQPASSSPQPLSSRAVPGGSR